MKICVVTPRYAISGVPLAQIRLARVLASRGNQVDLIVGRADAHLPELQIPGVDAVILGRPNARGMFIPLMSYMRKSRPDVIFSAEDHLNTLVLYAAILANSKAKITGSSRVTPFDTYSNVPFTKRWALKQLARLVAWRATVLTCVSEEMVDQYRRVFRSPRHVCVYNIVDDQASRTKMQMPVVDAWFVEKDRPILVAAGTLAPWKGFADLIRAMKELDRRGRSVRLAILGEGALRPELEALIAELGLSETVRLYGYVENPLKFFAHAHVFVLSSHVEGLPNVLVEAMMSGCTPVSTDCPTGPREVLQNGRYGYLVPARDPIGLADGIERALEKPIPPEILAEAVRPFGEDAVLQRHFELLGLPIEERRA